MTTINLLNNTIEIKRNGGILDDSLKKGHSIILVFLMGNPIFHFLNL